MRGPCPLPGLCNWAPFHFVINWNNLFPSFKTRSLKVKRQLKTSFHPSNIFTSKCSNFNPLKVNPKYSIKRKANGTIFQNHYKKKSFYWKASPKTSMSEIKSTNQVSLRPGHVNTVTLQGPEENWHPRRELRSQEPNNQHYSIHTYCSTIPSSSLPPPNAPAVQHQDRTRTGTQETSAAARTQCLWRADFQGLHSVSKRSKWFPDLCLQMCMCVLQRWV